MAFNLADAAYNKLNTYELFSGAGITFGAGGVTVTGGNWGSSPTQTYTGTVTGTPPAAVDNANAAAALAQLGPVGTAGTLEANLAAYRTALPSQTLSAVAYAAPITFLPGINYNSGSSLTFNAGGNITFDAAGNPNAQFFVSAVTSITFSTMNMTLTGGASSANIFWFAGSSITTTTIGTPVYGNFIADTSFTSSSGQAFNGRIWVRTGAISFTGVTTVTTTAASSVVCYARGTMILTAEGGYVPIETLMKGTAVVTRADIEGANYLPRHIMTKRVTWIGSFTVPTDSGKTMPIRIRKNALGHDAPFQDLYVSPGHRILLGGKIVPAWKLVNGTTITQEFSEKFVTYYHFETDGHSGVMANGVLAETLPMGSDDQHSIFHKKARAVTKPLAWLKVA